jgi:hypothetical protein
MAAMFRVVWARRRDALRSAFLAFGPCSGELSSRRWLSKNRMTLRYFSAAWSLCCKRFSRMTARRAGFAACRSPAGFVTLAELSVASPFAAAVVCVAIRSRHRPTNRVFSAYLPGSDKAGTGARPQTGAARVSRSDNATRTRSCNRAGSLPVRYRMINRWLVTSVRAKATDSHLRGKQTKAAGQGFEPQLPGPEPGVLPLDDPATAPPV